MQRIIYGPSIAVAAEYGSRAEEHYTIAEADGDDIYAVRGFHTHKAMMQVVRTEYAELSNREYVGR